MKISFRIFPNEIMALENQSEIGSLAHRKMREEVYKIYPKLKYIVLYDTYKCIMREFEGIDICTEIELPIQLEWNF